jgi:hypothetical protein
MADIMLDLESLGTRPDCAILTLGAVKFNPYDIQSEPGPGLYFRIDVDEQLSLGREVQEDTLEWWMRQSEDVREEALGESNRVSLTEMYQQLNRFLVGAGNIWCQGPAFDIVILENLYRQLGLPCPWQFWQIRDSRTLLSTHGDPRDKNKAGLHNALEDAVSQAQAVQTVFEQCGITEKR